jgi:hypothetical protein
MARVRIESIVDQLRIEFRLALSDALAEVSPEAHVDEYAMYRAFVRAIGRRCAPWERVRDFDVSAR